MRHQTNPSDREAQGEAPLSSWFLCRPEDVPERLRARGIPLVLVPLLPDELGQAFGLDRVIPGVDPEDEPLLPLAARGRNPSVIARELNLSIRTVQRRLIRLCRRFDLESRAELAAFLTERGF